MKPTMNLNMVPVSFGTWVDFTASAPTQVVSRRCTDSLLTTGENIPADTISYSRSESSIHKAVINARSTVIRPGRAVVELGNDGFGGLLQRFMLDLDDRVEEVTAGYCNNRADNEACQAARAERVRGRVYELQIE
jgi:hypothetical protein